MFFVDFYMKQKKIKKLASSLARLAGWLYVSSLQRKSKAVDSRAKQSFGRGSFNRTACMHDSHSTPVSALATAAVVAVAVAVAVIYSRSTAAAY